MFKKYAIAFFILYIVVALNFYTRYPSDDTVYIENEPNSLVRNDEKLTLYESPLYDNRYRIINDSLMSKLHRSCRSRVFLSSSDETIIYVLPPNNAAFLYTKWTPKVLNCIDVLRETSPINILDIDYITFPLFKKTKLIEIPLDKGCALHVPRGWFIFIKNCMSMKTYFV